LLTAAQLRRSESADVVVGVIEIHGCAEPRRRSMGWRTVRLPRHA
jgi:hypothetical protein